jgi:hypothetical protein
MAQRKLTVEQEDKFYADYVRMKTKGNYAGKVLDKKVWKNQVEEMLSEDATGKNWSNTEIRKASHQLARNDSWSRRQVQALERNLAKETNADVIEALKAEFGDNVSIPNLIRQKQGVMFGFLTGYSDNWNEYFNS